MEKRLTLNREVWFQLVEEARAHLRDPPERLIDSLTRGTSDAGLVGIGGTGGKLVRAWQLRAEGRFREAIREIESIPEDDNYYYHAKCGLAEFRMGLGEREAAARELDQALARAPKRPESHLIRAWLHLTEGRTVEAAGAARTAVAASARLREAEMRFLEEILLPRLLEHPQIAGALAPRWSPRGASQTGR
jgi:hypothetical protein